jgi:predicted Zn-dependent protease
MSELSRREQIEAMLADEPTDTFLRYALALELEKEGESARSLDLLRGLMGETPPHVPSFVMAAQQLLKHGQAEEARSVLREGIEQAREQGELHAAAKMSELLVCLGNLPE